MLLSLVFRNIYRIETKRAVLMNELTYVAWT